MNGDLPPPGSGEGRDLGRLSVTPDRGRIGTWGTWTVRYTAGTAGVAAGGGVLVELPREWHQWWRNASRLVQATDPAAPFYVSAHAAAPGVRLRCEVREERPGDASPVDDQFVKRPRARLAGGPSRYAWVVRVTVAEGAVPPGGEIEVRYGDRTGGSRGFTPPLWGESPRPVRAAVDASGGGEHVPLPEEALPLLRVEPGEALELAVVLPSTTAVGEPAEALVVALDANLNPAWVPGQSLTVRVQQGDVALYGRDGPDGPGAPAVPVRLEPAPAADGPAAAGPAERPPAGARVRFVPRAAGTLRLRAQSADGRLYAVSNASRCGAAPLAERLYWGDLHGHTGLSGDGTGALDDAFRYARDVSGLEVYGNADHHNTLSDADWARTLDANERFNAPGRFVTLVGYEFGAGLPFGHHNVFFRGTGEPPLRDGTRLDGLWERATPGELVTIPHHTVALGRPGRPNIDWGVADDRFRRVAEIYSGHGQSELAADDHPLASDVVDFTLTGPAGPNSAVRDGWLAGQRMGTIASSDNHCARPGREGWGVMAVYAPALTREAVFDAICRRRTYATTGSRIVLDFAVNGTPMGGEHALAPGETVRLVGAVAGTGPLRFVEVLRGDLDDRAWRVAHRQWFTGLASPAELTLDWTDDDPPARGLYYLRVRQRDLVHGRVAMAWSSPVWVQRRPAPQRRENSR